MWPIPVPRDRNCSFSPIAWHLQRSSPSISPQELQTKAIQVRKEVVKHMKEYISCFLRTIPLKERRSYLQHMRNNRTYGDHLELHAASDLYHFHAVVVTRTHDGCIETYYHQFDDCPRPTYYFLRKVENLNKDGEEDHYSPLQAIPIMNM